MISRSRSGRPELSVHSSRETQSNMKQIKDVAAAQQRLRRAPTLASAQETFQAAKRRRSVSGQYMKLAD